MPYGGLDWLALTQEDAIEPELPICDPHHHFWDFRMVYWPYQRYWLDDLLADISGGHNVRSTVFIQARAMYRADGPEELRPVGEVEFVNGLAAASASGLYGPCRVAAAIVGYANLMLGAQVEPVLDALQVASPSRFRGIRHITTWDPHAAAVGAATNPQGMLARDDFRAGARVLARKGLSFDAFLYFHQLPELADFARAIPDLPIVVNHIGGLQRTGPYAGKDDEVTAAWRNGIAAVAACPNVTMKLGGLGMPAYGFDWHTRATPIGSEELAAQMAPWLTYCIEQFGPDRAMFESNFPVDKVSFSYTIMYNAFKRLSQGYSASERAALLHDTAARVYRISE